MKTDPTLALRRPLKSVCRAVLAAAAVAAPLSPCHSADNPSATQTLSEREKPSLTEAQSKFQLNRPSPLWGELPPGKYPVGFRTVFRFDVSRTWRSTRDYEGNLTPDAHGRPVQVNVWYPASSNRLGSRMTFGSYVDQSAPEEFSALNSIMTERNLQNAKGSVASAQLEAFRSTLVNAYAGAPPATGSFPTALYFGGLNADVNSNFVLAEFLASHGYVVASISLIGATDQQSSQTRTPSDLDTVVRDMEFALSILGEGINADKTKLAVMGHSLGAIEAAMFGLRNGNVLAVVGLDGTYGFKGSGGILTNSFRFSPEKMRASFLDVRRAQGEQDADLDLTPVLSFRYSDRSLIALTNMHHSDFTSFAMAASVFQVPIKPAYAGAGWNRKTGQRGYEATCQMILGYLDEKVKREIHGSERFRQALQRADSSFTHLDAGYAPLSPIEVVRLAKENGLAAVKSLLTKIAGDQPVGASVDANWFNAYGYELMGRSQSKDAVVVLEIVAWAHPSSANAQDSLADAYLAIGDKEKARTAVQRSIELAPADPSIRAEDKPSFIKEENRRLEQMN